MTQLEQLKNFYNQFSNLADEIKSMIDAQEYNEAITKVIQKETLVNQFLNVRKMVTLSAEEKTEVEAIEKNLMAREKENIDRLTNLRQELSSELNKTKKNLRLNNAYTMNKKEQGSIVDLSE